MAAPRTLMTQLSTPLAHLYADCEARRVRIRQEFESRWNAREALSALCQLADDSVVQIHDALFPQSHRARKGFSLLAVGGYGRRMLFPYSDLDLLFLFEHQRDERRLHSSIAELSRNLWDLGFRVSSAGRTIEECKRIEEDNAEFHLALLDRRFMGGDRELYDSLNTRVLRSAERRAKNFLTCELARLTRERHARYGNTIFHLEPNAKEAPGGLRDFHASTWLDAIAKRGEPEARKPPKAEDFNTEAIEFIGGVRCFLHYANGRNDNSLTYELQAVAAGRSLGVPEGTARDPAEWMRTYFRHARTLNRQLLHRLELHADRPSFWSKPRAAWAARSGKRFRERAGRLEVAMEDPLKTWDDVFALLSEAARTGVPLCGETEDAVRQIWKRAGETTPETPSFWPQLRELLAAGYPAIPLRTMHRLGLLAEVLPEFRAIDALVVRDFYHRYTVDEHSLRTIEHLQDLGEPKDERAAHFTDLWKSLEGRELLVLALLLHDVGKGMTDPNHVIGSLQALDSAALRFQLDAQEKDEVRFLIEHHLDMSATLLRRDIFDSGTVAAFSRTVSTVERLSRLCLMTYADIHAVNPEALTPWKAEMLWQLFAAASNHLNRSIDRDRLHAYHEAAVLDEVVRRAEGAKRADIETFLEGFPRRYLAVHSPAEIAAHFLLSQKLAADPVQIVLKANRHAYSLTLLAQDRPALFATIAGVLAGWGMSIMKADAFANSAGVVLDTFHFVDLHRTLELNPSEVARFRRSLTDVLCGRAPLEPLLKARTHAAQARPPKLPVATKVRFDDESSAHSTLLEILTQDRPGLLYEIGAILSRLGCNIEVALIDTEGLKAIDVFYLTKNGGKLTPDFQHRIATEFWGRI